MSANSKQIFAELLWKLADLEQANSPRRSFASWAYRKAVWTLDHLPAELTHDRGDLLSVPSIGDTIADLALEFLETGALRRLGQLQLVLPWEAERLARLPRMTPTRMRALKSDLGVETASDLIRAIDEGRVDSLRGLGPGTFQVWRQRLIESNNDSLPLPRAVSMAERFKSHLQHHLPEIEFELTGAVERLDEWIDAIELSASSLHGLSDFLSQSALVMELGKEPKRVSARTLAGPIVIGVDPPIAPELAPAIIRPAQLVGDFHLHSDWSPDGRQTLPSIVANARAMGWKYIAITDHAIGLRFGGLDADGISRQHDEIVQVREENPDLLVLQGAELNIGRDGSLDFEDEVLAALDFRLAAVHSHFGFSQREQTERLVKAISHPLLHAVAHLTGRRIGVRPPIDLDLEVVIGAAAEFDTALEVNGHLDRLDISAEVAERAASRGVLFLINSDAHRPNELRNVFNGVKVLQRAGVGSEQVVNTWEPDRLRAWLKAK